MAIIVKRVPTSVDEGEEVVSETKPPASDVAVSTEAADIKLEEVAMSSSTIAPGQACAKVAPISGSMEELEEKWRTLPEIVLFWARNRRRGGTLVVCPDQSMDRLIQAYVVCEVVEASKAKQSM